MNPTSERSAAAAIATLLILQIVMLLSLYTRTFPHPPETVAPFGIAPFLAASLSFGVAALILGPTGNMAGRALSGLTALAALVSYGPQKYIDPQFGLIWPSVLVGQGAVILLLATLWVTRCSRAGHNLSPDRV